MRRRPLGFVVLALPLGVVAVAFCIVLIVDTRPSPSTREALVNLLLIAWTTLAGTTAVALWRVEQWAGRALAWTLGLPLVLVALSRMAGRAPGSASMLLVPALLAAAAVVYVRLRLAALHPTPPAARAAARRWP